ncbi:hypothetical protein DNTS_016105 [Danionella cerebrum]|uniref:G-protein coupled receptors family 1 profile domain-containing protein n=1 Tax=Danionella cerebrum TaxID=2873325 RepID=A0A553Q677_9TELE|nr:hypothetical protein DNTS_016105 [Danionella translucida]
MEASGWGEPPDPVSHAYEVTIPEKSTPTLSYPFADVALLQSFKSLFIPCYTLIALLGVSGNSLLIYVICRSRKMHNVTNFFIGSLAFSDMLMCVTCVPFTLAYAFNPQGWAFGRIMCYLVFLIQPVTVYVSVFTFTAIAVDRETEFHSHMHELSEGKNQPFVEVAQDLDSVGATSFEECLGYKDKPKGRTVGVTLEKDLEEGSVDRHMGLSFSRPWEMVDVMWGGPSRALTNVNLAWGVANTHASNPVIQYYAMVHPLKNRISIAACVCMLSGIWLLSCVLVAPAVAHTYHVEFTDEGLTICEEFWLGQEMQRLVYAYGTLLLTYILPLSAVCVSYLCISVKLRKSVAPGHRTRDQAEAQRAKKIKIFRLVSFVVAAFGVCWLPIHIFNVLRDIDIHLINKRYFLLIQLLCHMCAMSSSCCNPFLYAWLHDRFRAELQVWAAGEISGGVAEASQSFQCRHDNPVG